MQKKGVALRYAALLIGLGALSVGMAAAWLDRYGRGAVPPGPFDAIIVPGCVVRANGQPSGALRRRAERAAEIFLAGGVARLVLTGGTRDDRPTEAEVAAEVCRALGVPVDALVCEVRSRTTAENARFAADQIDARRILVVTDCYHVWRCERLFSRVFAEVSVVGVIPPAPMRLRMALREVVSVTRYLWGRRARV